MSVSSTVRIAGPFTGTGTASTFPFPFVVFQPSDVLVVSLNVGIGVQSTLVLNTDYSVALNPNQDASPGGTITLLAGSLATGYTLVISSAIPQLQGTELTNQGGFYPEVLTNSLDLLTILIQQLQEQINRAMSFPISDPSSVSNQLPPVSQRAGMYLTFDANGNPQATTATATTGVNIGYGTTISTAGQTVFSVPLYVMGSNTLFVFAGGLMLTKGADYTETSTSTITLLQPSPAGEIYAFRTI